MKPEWMLHARCATTDPDDAVWFPNNGDNPNTARRICFDCPVLSECRAYALGLPGLHGVWGGLTELQRARLHAPLRCFGCGESIDAGRFCRDCLSQRRRDSNRAANATR